MSKPTFYGWDLVAAFAWGLILGMLLQTLIS